MKTFETAQDVLNNARELHHRAGELYRQMRDDSKDDRARMLLNFMSEHEQRMETSLARYEQHAPQSVLQTWMQYTLEEPPELFIQRLGITAEMTIDDITALGQKVDNYLVDLFEEVTETAATNELKEVFQNLVAMEEEEKHSLTRAANSLWEL
ncbi:MAG: hypothetical protein V3T17_08010 [Pseudomonadales bacterium]